jgi:hypothetical protein
MKKLKLMLTTLSIVFALSGVFAPVARADSSPTGKVRTRKRCIRDVAICAVMDCVFALLFASIYIRREYLSKIP